MRAAGKLLQLVGLILLPLGILMQLTSDLSLGRMLALAAAGFAAFWIGRILEGYAR